MLLPLCHAEAAGWQPVCRGLEQSGGAHALFSLVELSGIGADIRQAHGGGGNNSSDLQRGLGHDGLIAVAIERVDKRGKLIGKTAGGGDVASIK